MTRNTSSHRPINKGLIFFFFVILILIGLLFNKFMQRHFVQQKLDEIRAAGLPATAAELEKWHTYPPDDQNAALKLFETANLIVYWPEKPIPKDPYIDNLYPIDIQYMLRLDSAPADWETKNKNLLPIVGALLRPDPTEPLHEKTKLNIEQFLADNAPALQLLHEALQQKQSRFPIDYSPGFKTDYSNQVFIGDNSKLLELQTIIHLDNNQVDQAVLSLIDSFQLVRVVHQEPVLMGYMIGRHCLVISLGSLNYTLNQTTLNHDQLNRITTAIDQMQSINGLSRALIGERCFVSDTFGVTIEDDIFFPNLKYWNPLLKTLALVEIDRLQFLEYMDQLIIARQDSVTQFFQVTESIKAESEQASPIRQPLNMIISGMCHIMNSEILRQTQLRTAQTAIAIEHYRRDHQENLPTTLADLVPDYLDSLPIDPYDAKPLKFKKLKTGYLVYSVGTDKTDNQGRDPDGADFGPGFDIPFTIKR